MSARKTVRATAFARLPISSAHSLTGCPMSRERRKHAPPKQKIPVNHREYFVVPKRNSVPLLNFIVVGCCVFVMRSSGLTKKAEPCLPRDGNRDRGTRSTVAARAKRHWLRRMVRQHHISTRLLLLQIRQPLPQLANLALQAGCRSGYKEKAHRQKAQKWNHPRARAAAHVASK